MSKISRRDFLKIAVTAPAAMAFSKVMPNLLSAEGWQGSSLPNVIILEFDAMTARNLSLYGYPRKTTPNLERFAERATVYHSHHSAGNFTTSGVASLLTGMYPWSHRAINQGGRIARHLVKRNFFRFFGEEYNRLAFAQNSWVDIQLNQLGTDVETRLSPGSFSIVERVISERFRNDANAAYAAFDDFLFDASETTASLTFGLLDRLYLRYRVKRAQNEDYPAGLPFSESSSVYFRLEDLFDGLIAQCAMLRPPYLAFYHIHPPHAAYNPNKKYWGIYRNDKWKPISKPWHRLGGQLRDSELNKARRRYDEFVTNVDAEFGRFLDALNESGILDQSYVIVTSDHGEMFERGEKFHGTNLLYEPEVHIPLLISTPGQRSRKDVYSPTNNVDILPTLLHIAGKEVPDWCEGELLPGFGGQENAGRVDFTMQAWKNPAFAPLTKITLAMRKGKYKIVYYTGYKVGVFFELYDLESDPEELNDLYLTEPSMAVTMREELLARLQEVNQPYE